MQIYIASLHDLYMKSQHAHLACMLEGYDPAEVLRKVKYWNYKPRVQWMVLNYVDVTSVGWALSKSVRRSSERQPIRIMFARNGQSRKEHEVTRIA